MSTPPPLPDDTLDLTPHPRKRSLLAKLTITLTVILGVTFGLCTVSAMTARTISDHVITTVLIIEAICILGLLVIAIIVIFRAFQGDY